MTAVTPAPVKTGQSLVQPALFDTLVTRMVREHGHDHHMAARIMDQALAFLAACAHNHGDPLAPSEAVDVGWHTFLLHTREYREFCHRIAGRFLDHVPTEDGDPAAHGDMARDTLARTVAAIDTAGYRVDADLWPQHNALQCTGCHNGCHDDPPPAR